MISSLFFQTPVSLPSPSVSAEQLPSPQLASHCRRGSEEKGSACETAACCPPSPPPGGREEGRRKGALQSQFLLPLTGSNLVREQTAYVLVVTSCSPGLSTETTDFPERGVGATKYVWHRGEGKDWGRGREVCVLSWTHRFWSLHCNTLLQWTWVSPVGSAFFCCCWDFRGSWCPWGVEDKLSE